MVGRIKEERRLDRWVKMDEGGKLMMMVVTMG